MSLVHVMKVWKSNHLCVHAWWHSFHETWPQLHVDNADLNIAPIDNFRNVLCLKNEIRSSIVYLFQRDWKSPTYAFLSMLRCWPSRMKLQFHKEWLDQPWFAAIKTLWIVLFSSAGYAYQSNKIQFVNPSAGQTGLRFKFGGWGTHIWQSAFEGLQAQIHQMLIPVSRVAWKGGSVLYFCNQNHFDIFLNACMSKMRSSCPLSLNFKDKSL
jgi:hypothetical protein